MITLRLKLSAMESRAIDESRRHAVRLHVHARPRSEVVAAVEVVILANCTPDDRAYTRHHLRSEAAPRSPKRLRIGIRKSEVKDSYGRANLCIAIYNGIISPDCFVW